MLISRFKEIESLKMTPMNGKRPCKAEAIVVIDGMVVVRLPQDRWWASWPNFQRLAYLPGTYNGRVQNLLLGLVALNLIPQAVADEHIEIAKAADDRSEEKYHRETIVNIAKKRGPSFVRKALKAQS